MPLRLFRHFAADRSQHVVFQSDATKGQTRSALSPFVSKRNTFDQTQSMGNLWPGIRYVITDHSI